MPSFNFTERFKNYNAQQSHCSCGQDSPRRPTKMYFSSEIEPDTLSKFRLRLDRINCKADYHSRRAYIPLPLYLGIVSRYSFVVSSGVTETPASPLNKVLHSASDLILLPVIHNLDFTASMFNCLIRRIKSQVLLIPYL